MEAHAPAARIPPGAIFICAAAAALSVAVVADTGPEVVALGALLVAALAAAHRTLLRWEVLLTGIVLCVLFVPITRYTLPASLPFKLELYRLLVATVLLCWITSVLIDSRVRIRRTAFDAPIILLIVVVFASEVANRSRVESVDSYVTKALMTFFGLVLVYYFVTSTMVHRRALEFALGVLVGGGAVVAVAAAIERRVGYNVFWHLDGVLPFLNFQGGETQDTIGRLRVFASAEHPIALGALFAILLPIGVGLARWRGRIWWLPTALLAVGVMSAASRTPIIMLAVSAAIFLWLKPRETVRLLPLLVPAVVIVHAIVPGTIGTIRYSFFPPGGLIEQQSRLPQNADPLLAGGRIRLLGPSLDLWAERPVVGLGYATRVTGFSEKARNAPILDNQWLDTLLEVGALGAGAWLWMFLRAGRRLGRAARDGPPRDDWLFASLAAAIVSFGVGMVFYDAFSFTQVTFVFWVVLALAAAALRLHEEETARADARAAEPVAVGGRGPAAPQVG
jgi:hypothetical protein